MRSIGSDLDPLALNSSGERLMIVDVLVHDETLFALLGWYAPSPESEEPGTGVLDCRLELVRMNLADGEIAGSLALADKAVVVARVPGLGGSLTRMSDGAILVTNTVGQPRFALAVVVDPDSMTARLDAASVVDAPKGSYTLEHLGEGVLRRTIWDEHNQPTSRILVDMRSGERIEAEQGWVPARVLGDWLYSFEDGKSDDAFAPWRAVDLRAHDAVQVDHRLPGRCLMNAARLENGIVIIEETPGGRKKGSHVVLGEAHSPGATAGVTIAPGEDLGYEALVEHGGLLWPRSVGDDASGAGELVCWDPADGAEAGRIAVVGGVGLAGLSAWGYWTTTAFVPATAWGEGIEEWKNAVA